jgi:hypothetical protein
MLVISITGIFSIPQILNPTSVWVLTVVCGHIVTLTKKRQECHHQQDDYACMPLSGGCNIIALLGGQDFPRMSCHQVDVTSSQSKAQCLLTSFRQTTKVNNCTVNIVS